MTDALDPMLAGLELERRARSLAFEDAVTREVLDGGRVESQTDTYAVVAHGRPVNHLLHLLLTIVTSLLWAPVWIGITIGARKPSKIILQLKADGSLLRMEAR